MEQKEINQFFKDLRDINYHHTKQTISSFLDQFNINFKPKKYTVISEPCVDDILYVFGEKLGIAVFPNYDKDMKFTIIQKNNHKWSLSDIDNTSDINKCLNVIKKYMSKPISFITLYDK